MIQAAANQGDLVAAQSWFERAEKANMKPDAGTLDALAGASRAELPEDIEIQGLDGFGSASEAGKEPGQQSEPFKMTLGTYGTLIDSAQAKGELSVAESWLRQGVKMGYKPSARTLEGLVRASAETDGPATAERWFTELAKMGIGATAGMFNCMLDRAVKEGD